MSESVFDQKVDLSGDIYKEHVNKAMESTFVGHYIFQWNPTAHRRIGPFGDKEAAVSWGRDYDSKYHVPRWVLEQLTQAQAAKPPKVASISYWGDPVELSSEPSYFVMTWDTTHPVFTGEFATCESAQIWGAGWQRGKDDHFFCWEVRHLVGTSLLKPIEIIDPNTPDLPPLVEGE